MEVNDTTTSYTQTLEWTIDFSYTTYSPSFPLANGVVTVDVPDDMFIDESTIDVDIDGDYLDFDEDDDIYEFSFAFEDTPTSSNSTRRIYEGNITFETTMDISASSPRIRATLGCYDLESLAS